MSELRHNRPPRLDLCAAASLLSVSESTIESLVAGGYLLAAAGRDGPEFALADLRAFLARNADNGSGNIQWDEPDGADPQVLLDALDGRSEEMARRAFDIFASAFPEAHGWSLREQARFIDQAKNRFEAILAVTSQGSAVDEALVGDLQDVGAAAAWSGSPLPQLLVILRISRDLVVQTAVDVAEQGGRHWGLALSLLLTRVLPAMDRLTDALAQGYWAALAGREEELRDRYEHVVETSSNGVYEVDQDGRLQYANPSLGIILGRPLEQLHEAAMSEVFGAVSDAALEALISEPPAGITARHEVTAVRSDGVRRLLEIHTTARYRFDELVGFQGVVRDITTAHDLESDKNNFVALVTRDLRSPLATLMGQGSNLEANADELGAEQVARIGSSIRGQVERISRLADDLVAVSHLDSSQLVVSTRPVDLAQVVHAALPSVRRPGGVDVRIPLGVEVLADPRRLEQVVANVIDNGLEHGREPIVVELAGADAGLVGFTIVDHGDGVPPDRAADLFAGLRTLANADREGSRGTGLGLSVVKGLIEAMGGRVAYEPAAGGGACFRLVLPVPHRRA
jgi:PAS domain S-box-containing protein